MKLIKLLFLSLIMISLSSCKKEADDAKDYSFTLKLNGKLYKAKNITAILTQDPNNTGHQRFDIHTSNDKNVIHLAFEQANIDDCMHTGNYIPEFILIEVSYKLSNGGSVTEHMPKDDQNGDNMLFVEVTKCQNKHISGNFTATLEKIGTLQNEIDTPQLLEITEGKFENIPFTISQF